MSMWSAKLVGKAMGGTCKRGAGGVEELDDGEDEEE